MIYDVLFALLLASCQRKERKVDDDDRDVTTSTSASSTSQTPETNPPPKPDVPPQQMPQQPVPPLPDPLPGKRTDVTSWVGGAWRAAIGDIDGDKANEIVLADSKELRVVETSGKQLAALPITAGIHVLAAHDIDGDGKAEILTGWGQSRDWRDAKARIAIYRLKGGKLEEELVVAPDTQRPEVVAVQALPDKTLLVAYYDSKFNVTSAIARKGAPAEQAWQLSKLGSIRMATSYARGDLDGDGKPDLVVGRVYGDDKGIDGDAFILGAGGARTKLPTTRGLRSLVLVGSDLFVGDGWHQNYGEHARGLLTWIRKDKTGFTSTLVENTAGQYAIEKMLPATVAGKSMLVTHGSHYVRVFAREGQQFRGLSVAAMLRDVAVGDLDGKPGDELLLVGDTSEIVELAKATWPSK